MAASGAGAVGFGLGLVLAAAWLVGLRNVIWGRRNLMSASIQIASYLGGYLVLWAAWAAASAAGIVYVEPVNFYFSSSPILDPDVMAFLIWFTPNIALLIGFFILVARGTAAARYANR